MCICVCVYIYICQRLKCLYNFIYVNINLRDSSVLQREGKSEVQAKEEKGCPVASSVSSAFIPNVVSASAEMTWRVTAGCHFPHTGGGTEHGHN